MREVVAVGVPSSAGAYAPGQETAPRALREAGLLSALGAVDRGDVVQEWRWRPDPVSPRAMHVARAGETIDAVRDAVLGGANLVLGGDCTVGLGTVAGVPGAGVVYLDLHADMNVPASTVDGALDWMGLGHALGLQGAEPSLVARCSLRPPDVVLLGFATDQATEWEREQVAALAVPVIEAEALRGDPVAAAASALSVLPDDAPVVVHFDVDVIDFVDAPLSENPGRNVGVPLATAATAFGALLGSGRVRAVTITELNPLHGAADGSTVRRFVDAIAGAWT